MIDWYDKNQCHHNDVNGHDRTNGRIFKVSLRRHQARASRISPSESTEALVALQTLAQRVACPALRAGFSRSAGRAAMQRELLDELDAKTRDRAGRPASHPLGAACRRRPERSRCDRTARSQIPTPTIRAWTIQLATEQGPPAAPILARFAELARTDPSPVVRLYLASALAAAAARRSAGRSLAGLVGHGEDASDHNLPLMYWYAAEPLAALDPARAARLAASIADSADPGIHGAADRRARERPNRWRSWSASWAEPAARPGVSPLLVGIEEGLRGRRQVRCPPPGPTCSRFSAADADAGVRSRAVALGLNFGDPAARDSLRRVLDRLPRPDLAAARRSRPCSR